jgi:hypothetical protein
MFPNEHQIQLSTTSLSLSPDGQTMLLDTDYVWTLLQREGEEKSRILGQHLGQTPQWLPDSRRFLSQRDNQRGIAFDMKTNRRLGTLFPSVGDLNRTDNWLCVGPNGHYRGSDGIEEHIVYVALLEDGRQETFTPAEFRHKFGWTNDPTKATLLELAE